MGIVARRDGLRKDMDELLSRLGLETVVAPQGCAGERGKPGAGAVR